MKKQTFLAISLVIISLALASLSGCDKEPAVEIIIKAPTVELTSVSDVSETEATIIGRISSSGGSKIKERGIYLNGELKIAALPLSSEATFSVALSDLEPDTKYSVKAYAVNSEKIGYSSSLEFSTLKIDEPEPDPVPVLSIKEATAVEHYSAILHGTMSDVVHPDDYVISFEYSLDESFDMSIAAEQSSSGENSLRLRAAIEELDPTSTYSYRLKAQDNVGEIFYSDTATFTTTGDNFSIDEARFMNVATDAEGNVYATAWYPKNNDLNLLVAKFSSQGNLLWRQNIKGEYGHVHYKDYIAVHKGVVYVAPSRYSSSDRYYSELDHGLEAYDALSGELLWSKAVISDMGLTGEIVISEDDFIYLAQYKHFSKLDLNGNILAQYTASGPYSFYAVSANGNKIFVVGSRIFEGGHQALLWYFDDNLNINWVKPGIRGDLPTHATDVIYFPEKDLIFVAEVEFMKNQMGQKTLLVAYDYKDTGPTMKWKKKSDIRAYQALIKDGTNFYSYSTARGSSDAGPYLYNTNGDIIWSLDSVLGGKMAVFGDKLYMATNEKDYLVVIRK